MLCSMIIFERGKRIRCTQERMSGVSTHDQPRFHGCTLGCTYVVGNAGPRVRRAYLPWKSISFSCFLSFADVRYFFHQNATILVLFFFPSFPSCSFFLLCAVYRPAEKLLKKWHLPLFPPLSRVPLLYLEFLARNF